MGLNFLEINVRTYVHLDGEGPGVFFLSLEASSWLAVKAARFGWGLPYFHASMTMTGTADGGFEVESVRRADGSAFRAGWTPGEPTGPSVLGSDDHFFLRLKI